MVPFSIFAILQVHVTNQHSLQGWLVGLHAIAKVAINTRGGKALILFA